VLGTYKQKGNKNQKGKKIRCITCTLAMNEHLPAVSKRDFFSSVCGK